MRHGRTAKWRPTFTSRCATPCRLCAVGNPPVRSGSRSGVISARLDRFVRYQFRAPRIESQLRHLTAQQLLLHVGPISDPQQIAVVLSEAAAGVVVRELHSVVEFLGKKDHAIL